MPLGLGIKGLRRIERSGASADVFGGEDQTGGPALVIQPHAHRDFKYSLGRVVLP